MAGPSGPGASLPNGTLVDGRRLGSRKLVSFDEELTESGLASGASVRGFHPIALWSDRGRQRLIASLARGRQRRGEVALRIAQGRVLVTRMPGRTHSGRSGRSWGAASTANPHSRLGRLREVRRRPFGAFGLWADDHASASLLLESRTVRGCSWLGSVAGVEEQHLSHRWRGSRETIRSRGGVARGGCRASPDRDGESRRANGCRGRT